MGELEIFMPPRVSPTQQEISITVRPQVAATQSSAAPDSYSQVDDRAEQARMRSSIALQPRVEVVPTAVQPTRASRLGLKIFTFQRIQSYLFLQRLISLLKLFCLNFIRIVAFLQYYNILQIYFYNICSVMRMLVSLRYLSLLRYLYNSGCCSTLGLLTLQTKH